MSTQTDLEAKARAAWEAGFSLAINYGDNYVHCQGEQRERQWKAHWDSACSLTQPKEGLSENTLKDLTDFWKSAWDEDGTREKIINELWDYTVFMENTAKVYDHLTRGNISKVNTLPQAVIDEVERIHQEEIDEAVDEAAPSVDVRGLTADNERLRALVQEMRFAGNATRRELGRICERQIADGMVNSALKSGSACDKWDAILIKEQGFTPTNTEDK